ncbi:MAG: hypothetical protein VKK04_19535 [Synechococcales bacterium]|nr:hypothetical protein [Synechococcales bacterium]
MFGTFQHSRLRIELDAPADAIQKSLLNPEYFQQWLWPQQFSVGLPAALHPGLKFTGWLGPIAIRHDVDFVDDQGLRLLLSQGIDGFHEWHWGDGWVQSCLEGVSVLPLNLGQTASLLRLRQFLGNSQRA